ncbi:hypothetical protein B7P43_G05718 [Cryptotermes secundus]|uniref:Endonuclease/exonuclease/phosphatase domain-containing protein n=1 Tax=Cryptotermes secundus TaxID=105785 RepID=A0A2J7PND7_9NEOP|nr:hypothetical protein B7P43_G05718 [Cryptotermes secundus]
MINSYGLQAIVDVPTRIGSRSQTAIDQIILKKGLREYKFEVSETGFSDHSAQILQVQMKQKNKNKKGQARAEGEYRMVRNYSKKTFNI